LWAHAHPRAVVECAHLATLGRDRHGAGEAPLADGRLGVRNVAEAQVARVILHKFDMGIKEGKYLLSHCYEFDEWGWGS
jgi:hypothetical protein